MCFYNCRTVISIRDNSFLRLSTLVLLTIFGSLLVSIRASFATNTYLYNGTPGSNLNITGLANWMTLATTSIASGTTLYYSFTGNGNLNGDPVGTPLYIDILVRTGGGSAAGNSFDIVTTSSATYTGSFTTTGAGSTLKLAGGSMGTTYDLSSLQVWTTASSGSSGPSSADTQTSLTSLASSLVYTYAIQSSLIDAGLTYDCTMFDAKGVCASFMSGLVGINFSSPDTGNGVLIGGYRLNDHVRIGAWVNQEADISEPTGVNNSNSNPMFGAFVVWNKDKPGNGLEIKASVGFETNTTTTTRQISGTSEAGSGSAGLTTFGASLIGSYTMPMSDTASASPYGGIRYTNIGLGSYTEDSSGSVTTPLSYQSMNQTDTTVIAGLKLDRKINTKVGITGSVGVEQDLINNGAAIQATGSSLTLSDTALASTYNATRFTSSLGLDYEIAPAKRLGFNVGVNQSTYLSNPTTSAMVAFTAGF